MSASWHPKKATKRYATLDVQQDQERQVSSQINRYGLTRSGLTEPIKRIVRQRCGFGCVICGSAFIEYDHFEPEFADALVHDPAHIILLCPHHHALKTKAPVWLNADEIRAASESPAALKEGYSEFAAPRIRIHPTVVFGELTCIRAKSILSVDGFNVFSIRDPEVDGGPYRVNAFLSNSLGTEMIEIVDNEVRASTKNWDMTLQGATLKIWEASRQAALVLRFESDRIVVERLAMVFRGLEIEVQEGRPTRLIRHGQGLSFFGATFTDSDVVANFDATGMMLGKGGKTQLQSMMMGDRAWLDTRPQSAIRMGGMAHSPVRFAPGEEGIGTFGLAGLIANRFCAFPANDESYAPLP